jgi:hypothetical protein
MGKKNLNPADAYRKCSFIHPICFAYHSAGKAQRKKELKKAQSSAYRVKFVLMIILAVEQDREVKSTRFCSCKERYNRSKYPHSHLQRVSDSIP